MKKFLLLGVGLSSVVFADTSTAPPTVSVSQAPATLVKPSASSVAAVKYADPTSTVIANKSNTSFLGAVISETSMPVYKAANYTEALNIEEWIVNTDTGMTITNNSDNDVNINNLSISIDNQQCNNANVKLLVKAHKKESSYIFTRDKLVKCGLYITDIFKNLGGDYKLIDIDSNVVANKYLQSQNGLFLYPIKITINYSDQVGQGSIIHNTFVVYQRD